MARFPITLTQLTYFEACARSLHMTLASQELHVAQSAVSSAINQLERALGTSLFIRRHAKGLVLTPAGERLLHETRRLFDQLDLLIDSVQAESTSVGGSLRVAVFNTFSPTVLPRIIARLAEQHPDLSLEIIEGDHEQNIDALRTGKAEVALTYNYSTAPDILADVVGEVRPYVIVGENSSYADRESISLLELVNEPLVLLDLPDSREYFLTLIRNAGGTPVVRHRTANFEALRSMVASGMGYSILNQRPVFDTTYSGRRAIAIEISDPVPSLEVAIVMLEQTPRTIRLQAFVDVAREVLGT